MEHLVEAVASNPFYAELYGPGAPRGPHGERFSALGGADAATVLALDCEMVLTASCAMELARVTIVGECGKVHLFCSSNMFPSMGSRAWVYTLLPCTVSTILCSPRSAL
jgi:hypothetical protein